MPLRSLQAFAPTTGHRRPRAARRRAPEDFGNLSEVELALLFRAVPHDEELKHLGDRALLGLLGLQALRTVEITRANVADAVLLPARGSIPPDELGETLIVADGNFARDHRLSRCGVRHMVDGYLRGANITRPQVSNHALHHTRATLSYRYTRARADARGLKAYAGAAPITRARGKKLVVLHRSVKNNRLAAAGYLWTFAAIRLSTGARAHYDRRRLAGDRHAAAQRNLFNRFLGCLHYRLQTNQGYSEQRAFAATTVLAA